LESEEAIMEPNPYEVTGSETPQSDDERARALVRGPALATIVLGYSLCIVFGCGLGILLVARSMAPVLTLGIPLACGLGLSVQLVRCGASLMRCESRSQAIWGAILAFVVFWPLGFFLMLWILFTLRRPEVKQVMDLARRS
jgi:hypothetical protein